MATVTLLGATIDTNAGTHTVVATPNAGDFIVVVSYYVNATSQTAQPTPTDNNSSGAYTSTGSVGKRSGASFFGRVEIHSRSDLIQSATSTTFTQTATGTSTGGGLVVLAIRGTRQLGARSAGSVDDSVGPPAPVLSSTPLIDSAIVSGQISSSAPSTARTGYTVQFEGTGTPGTLFVTPNCFGRIISLNSGETTATITWNGGVGGASAAEFRDTPHGSIVQANQSVNRGSTY